MRRILSILLCAAMLLGCVFSTLMTAKAAETVDEPSGSTSYRDEFIAALLEQEDKWYNHVDNYTLLGFTDLNFDGNLEFVVYPTFASEQTPSSYVYSDVDGQVEELFCDTYNISDNITYNGDCLPSIYYDENTNKYRTFTVTRLSVPEDGFTGSLLWKNYVSEIFYEEKYESELFLGSSFLMDFSGDNQRDQKYFIYDENKVEKQVSKKEYDEADRRNGLIDCHVKRKCLLGGENYQNSNKRETLENLYDSFTYDKYDSNDDNNDELIIETKELTDSDIKPEWKNVTSLSVKYPIFKTSDEALKKFLDENVTQKILSYMDTTCNDKLFISGDYKYDMSLDGYLSINGEIINRAIMSGSYATKGKYSFFVDLKNKKILALKDLFSDSESKVYEEIALKTDKYGKNGDNAFWFTGDVLLNYDYSKAKFNLNKDTLTIIFDAYEVAAGVAGAIEIDIPVSDINLTSKINGVNTGNTTPDVEIKGFELEYGIGCGEKVEIFPYLNYSNNTEPIVGAKLEFTSSNESVATIKKGESGQVVVTGVSGGTAILTAKETVTGATATYEVKVYNGTNFKRGIDNLSFTNSSDNFFNGFDSFMNDFSKDVEENGWNFWDFMMMDRKDKQYSINYLSYRIDDTTILDRLLRHSTEINSVTQKILNNKNSLWNGSCAGMCAVMDIMYADSSALPISKVFNNKYSDNTKVHDLPLPKDSSNMQDLINYYQLSQNFNYYNNVLYNQQKSIYENYSESINDFVNSINNTSTPVSVAISVVTKEDGKLKADNGHRILLLRIKSEDKDSYNVECYDPNEKNKFTELKLYKKGGEYSKNVFNISYHTDEHEYNVITDYLDSINTIDKFNFFSTEENDDDVYLEAEIIRICNLGDISVSTAGNTLIDNGNAVNDSVLGPVPTNVGAVADSEFDSASDMTYYVEKGLSDVYTVQYKDNDHYGQTEITLDDHMFSLTAKNSGTATFDDETGAVNVSMDAKSDYKVSVTDNENICGWDWFTMSISADDSKQMDIQFTDDGVLINGDNLKGTEVTVNNVNDESTLTIDENLTNVLIKKSGDEITATEVKQGSNTNKNTSNGTVGAGTSSATGKESADGVTTGDVTKVFVFLTVLAISGVVLALSLKRRRNN